MMFVVKNCNDYLLALTSLMYNDATFYHIIVTSLESLLPFYKTKYLKFESMAQAHNRRTTMKGFTGLCLIEAT